jgi:hypothetical protein
MYFLGEESCAGSLTEDEIAKLMTNAQVAGSLTFIGPDANTMQDKEVWHRICDKAIALIPREA